MPDGTGAMTTADAVDTLLGQAVAPVDQASETPEELEAETEEVEASSEEEVDVEAGEEAQAEAATDDDDEVEEAVADLYTVKVDGEEAEVTIDDLVKNYQLESTAQRRLSDAAQQRKQVDVDRTVLAQERERYAQGLQQIAATLEAQQPDESNLETLKEEDPFAYQEQKVAQLERAEAMRRVAAEQQGLHQQKIAEEGALLMERIPEWRDADVRAREQSAIVTYAKRVGFSDQELAQASDSRAIEVLRKAHLYDELVKNQVPRAKKKVAQAKKMVKGGQPKTQKQAASESQRKAYERFAQRGSTDAAVEYLLSKS
jgi:hypothetical protein